MFLSGFVQYIHIYMYNQEIVFSRQAGVVSILLYGCITWMLTKHIEKKLDGNSTKILWAVMNESWKQHPTKKKQYGHLPPIPKAIQIRRTRHAGHCWRRKNELISDVFLWPPLHGRASDDQLKPIYNSCEDTECCLEDPSKEEWRERLREICATGSTWSWWWKGE